MIKIICSVVVVIVLAISTFITVIVIKDGNDKYSVSTAGVEIPHFSSIELGFAHVYDSSRDLPFMAGAVIDVENDGVDELFLGGGVRQPDGLFRYEKGRFVDVADRVGLVKQGDDATLGAVVFDVDDNGFSDIIVTKKSGIWLYRNSGKQFSSEKIDADLSSQSIPLGVAVADLNSDGHFDMFVSAFSGASLAGSKLFLNGHGVGAASKLLINNGDDSFTDITEPAGVRYSFDALQAIFVDLDDDNLEDLVVLYSGGRLRTWKNLGSLLFENKKHSFSDTYGLYMGMGVGDYNGDGRIDFFLSNSGSTIPDFLARGDLPKDRELHSQWVLLHNKGAFLFEDSAEKTQLANYQLSRGIRFVDLNLDGKKDLVVSQNHYSWPPHKLPFFRLPGKLLLQNSSGQFAETAEESGVVNKQFSITPLIADFNNDGQPDIIHVNMAGTTRVFLSERGKNNYLKVQLSDSVESLGAMVNVVTLSGKVLKQPFLVGRELCSDSSHILFFGLGTEKATDVVVDYNSGERKHKSGEFFNTTIVIE